MRGALGLFFLAFFWGVAPALAPYDPLQTNLSHTLAPPSWAHPLGTDFLGRDVWSRWLYGGRSTLSLALSATVIAAVGGLGLGALAASRLPILGGVALALIDALLALPTLVVALVILARLGDGALSVLLAAGVAGLAPCARLTRETLESLRGLPHLEGARAVGAGRWRILRWHLLPPAGPILLNGLGLVFSGSLLTTSALSFLGFRGAPQQPDWGVMLAEGRRTFQVAPCEALAAGLALTLCVAWVFSFKAWGKWPSAAGRY